MCVGQSVCVSALRVCSVRGWSGHRVLSVTAESRLHPNSKTYSESEDTDTHSESHLETHTDACEEADTHAQSHIDTHTDTHLQQETEYEEAQVQDGLVRTKVSKIISYRVNLYTHTRHAPKTHTP